MSKGSLTLGAFIASDNSRKYPPKISHTHTRTHEAFTARHEVLREKKRQATVMRPQSLMNASCVVGLIIQPDDTL